MKLSFDRDLLLVIISSLAVLTISLLQLVKGNLLTFIEYIAILLLPGYSIITLIWPNEESIDWPLRAGLGFVVGLFFALFSPIIFESLNMGFVNENLIIPLLILAIILSLFTMVRRNTENQEEIPYGGRQLTLEESIRRAAELREMEMREHKTEEYEYDIRTDHYEYQDGESELEEYSEEEREYYSILDQEEREKSEEPVKYEQLKKEKPLQYERLQEMDYWDTESTEFKRPESAAYTVDGDVKTETDTTEYGSEMDRPIWMDEKTDQNTSKSWYNLVRNILLAILIIGLILFVMDLLGWNTGLFKDIPKTGIILLSSIILIAMTLLCKVFKFEAPVYDEEGEIPDDALYEEEIEEREFTIEEVSETEQAQTPPRTVTADAISKEPGEPSPFKPRCYYLDLILILALTILTVAFILIPPLNKTYFRTILGILLVLFIPGYSLIAALFPKWGDLDGVERAALSFGLSIAVTPLIGLGLNYTPWGIRLDPILINLTIFTTAMCVIAYHRRRSLSEEERYFVNFGGFTRNIGESFRSEPWTEKILSIILIIIIILAISTTVFIIMKPKQGEKFTEFYILGPEGNSSNYPTNLTSGDKGHVIIGLVNHEYATTEYELLVKVENRTLKNDTVILKNGEKKEIPFNFTAGSSGQKKMNFLIYKLPDTEKAYRSLHLWLNITT